jgi:hypothetical protein
LRLIKFSRYNLYMPNGVSSEQWFLEVNGKKFGPYTMAQINALVRHHEIVGEDRVTAPHLSGKWMTVQEFVNQSDRIAAAVASSQTGQRSAQSIPQNPPAAAPTVPPRPDERTLTSITAPAFHSNEQRKPQSDAVLNLFEILQAARERKTQTPTSAALPAIEMPRPVKSSGGGGLFWIAVPAMITVSIAAWRMTSTPPPAAVAESEAPVKAQAPAPKAAPVAVSAPAPKAIIPVRAVAATTPAAKPVVHATGFAVGRQAIKTPSAPVLTDRERERELEREREREAERELEREKEQRDEYARGNGSADSGRYDRDKEKDYDRRDRADRADRGDRGDRLDRSTASAGSPDALPVTGGIPAEPGDFRDRGASDTTGAEPSPYR